MPETTSAAQVPQEQLKQPASISTPANSPASTSNSPSGTSADFWVGRIVIVAMAFEKKDGRSNSGARAEVNLGRFPMRPTRPNFLGENPLDHLAVDIGQTSLDTVVVEGEFFVIDAQ